MPLPLRTDHCALDLLSLGALVHRLDPGVTPFRKARSFDIHVSGGEYNVAANLSDCFGLRTGIATAMVNNPIGDLVQAHDFGGARVVQPRDQGQSPQVGGGASKCRAQRQFDVVVLIVGVTPRADGLAAHEDAQGVADRAHVQAEVGGRFSTDLDVKGRLVGLQAGVQVDEPGNVPPGTPVNRGPVFPPFPGANGQPGNFPQRGPVFPPVSTSGPNVSPNGPNANPTPNPNPNAAFPPPMPQPMPFPGGTAAPGRSTAPVGVSTPGMMVQPQGVPPPIAAEPQG